MYTSNKRNVYWLSFRGQLVRSWLSQQMAATVAMEQGLGGEFDSFSNIYLKYLDEMTRDELYPLWEPFISRRKISPHERSLYGELLNSNKFYVWSNVDVINEDMTKAIEVKSNKGRIDIIFQRTRKLHRLVKSEGVKIFLCHCLYTSPSECEARLWEIKRIKGYIRPKSFEELIGKNRIVLENALGTISRKFEFTYDFKYRTFKFDDKTWKLEVCEFPIGESDTYEIDKKSLYDLDTVQELREGMLSRILFKGS